MVNNFKEYLEEAAKGKWSVFVKIKGDRLGGPDYDWKADYDTEAEAREAALKLNGGVKRPKGFESHVAKPASFKAALARRNMK